MKIVLRASISKKFIKKQNLAIQKVQFKNGFLFEAMPSLAIKVAQILIFARQLIITKACTVIFVEGYFYELCFLDVYNRMRS